MLAPIGEPKKVNNTKQERRIVFVTVGTTQFDGLVREVDSKEVKQELLRKGYTHLLFQLGSGSYFPVRCEGGGEEGRLQVNYFTFASSIAEHLRSASLVISHAGSGSIFEALRLEKPLVVVVNEDLMGNHQSELAEELAALKHLYCARTATLRQTLEDMNLESLLPLPPPSSSLLLRAINKLLHFPDE